MRYVLAAVVGAVLAAGPAWGEFTTSQETAILEARAAYLSSKNCQFSLNMRKLQAVLSSNNLTPNDVFSGTFSSRLISDLSAEEDRYRSNTASACEQAWETFGPSGPLKGLLAPK